LKLRQKVEQRPKDPDQVDLKIYRTIYESSNERDENREKLMSIAKGEKVLRGPQIQVVSK
jgi:hypothetical protein